MNEGILSLGQRKHFKLICRLYYHECQRVFHDRLTDETDRNIFCNSLAELCTNILGEKTNAQEMKGIIFGDFMKIGVDRENRIYDEVLNKDKLKAVLSVSVCSCQSWHGGSSNAEYLYIRTMTGLLGRVQHHDLERDAAGLLRRCNRARGTNRSHSKNRSWQCAPCWCWWDWEAESHKTCRIYFWISVSAQIITLLFLCALFSDF